MRETEVGIDEERSKTIYNNNDSIPELYSEQNSSLKLTMGKIEFDEDAQNQCPLGNYSEEARNIFYETCFQCTELHPIAGKFGNIPAFQLEHLPGDVYSDENYSFTREGRLTRFPDGKKIYVLLSTDLKYSWIEPNVVDWMNEINALLGQEAIHVIDLNTRYKKTGFSGFYAAKKEFPNECYIELSIYDYDAEHDGSTYGKMYRTEWDPITGATLEAKVIINVGDKINYYKSVLYEELTQALGCVNDVYCAPTSLFS